MAWPTKTDFVDGDVLTAAQVNNIGTNLNVFNPTAATNGQVLTANGSGSASFQTPAPGGGFTLIAQQTLTTNLFTFSAIPGTYRNLYWFYQNARQSQNNNIFMYPNGTGFATSLFELNNSYGTSWSAGSTAWTFNYSGSTESWATNTGWIYNYASTSTWKSGFWQQASEIGNASLPWRIGYGTFKQTAAITSITLQAAGAGSPTMSGTFYLYGAS
jgi:hypothetical protein